MLCSALLLLLEVFYSTCCWSYLTLVTGLGVQLWEAVDGAELANHNLAFIVQSLSELVLKSLSLCVCVFLSLVSCVEAEVPVATVAATSALEEMALYSNKRKLRQGRRSLEAAVPT